MGVHRIGMQRPLGNRGAGGSCPAVSQALRAPCRLPASCWRTQCRGSLSSAWPALTGHLLCAQPFPCAAHRSLPRAGRALPSTAGRRAAAESGVLAWPPCRGRTLCPLPQAVLRARNKVTLILRVGCWDGTRPTQFPPNLLGWFGPARPHARGASWCRLPYWLSLRAGTFGVCSGHRGCGPLGCPPWSLQSPRFEEPCWCPDGRCAVGNATQDTGSPTCATDRSRCWWGPPFSRL